MNQILSHTSTLKRVFLLAPPLVSLGIYGLLTASGLSHDMAATAAITLLCAAWWILEPLPIPATSLLPLALFPLLGVLTAKDIAQAYGNPMILLLMGGAMLSKAMESTGAHLRIALGLIRVFGDRSTKRLIFGFMLAGAALSMWVSNTATALMLLPVALAVTKSAPPKITVALLLAVAYGCSIGGLGTPIGTPPNIIFLKIYKDTTGDTISFAGWMLMAMPLVLFLLPLTWWWLTRHIHERIELQAPQSGRWSPAEKRVLGIFAVTALSWMTLDAPFGGWSTWLNMPNANYAAVALLAVVVMFVCPTGEPNKRLLDWEHAKDIEWGVLLLFAGGISLATAFGESGLSDLLGQQMTLLTVLPVWLMVLIICLSVTFLTEVTSNTATATVLMPILAAAANAMQIEPALLMIPAAISASCAFMLPVATPPNAIVFASGKLQIQDMARVGFFLNVAGACIISLWVMVMYG